MAVNELANISAPDANMVVVAPWDTSMLENIEKGIASSGLNLNPVVDGDIIRITIPALTEERRKEMVKLLHQKVEQGKVMFRNIRTEAKQEIEDLKGDDGVSEDDIHADLEKLDAMIKEYSDKLDKIAQDKEKELMTV
jgi:ribosome recycling factor